MPWLHTEPCPQHFITCPWIQSLCGGDKFFSVCSYASWAIDSKCQAECIGQLFPHQSCITKHSEIQWLKITVFCFCSFVGEVGVSWSKLYLAVLGSKPQVGFHWNSLSLMFFASVSCLTSLLTVMAEVQDGKPNRISMFQISATSNLLTFCWQIQVTWQAQSQGDNKKHSTSNEKSCEVT